MKNDKLTNNDIADAMINLSENTSLCDKETAIGMRTSKKKDILHSSQNNSFGKFTNEIKKRQAKKN